MGANDGDIGCWYRFFLYQLSNNYNKKDIGLYRDDGWAVFKKKFFFYQMIFTVTKQTRACNKLI